MLKSIFQTAVELIIRGCIIEKLIFRIIRILIPADEEFKKVDR